MQNKEKSHKPLSVRKILWMDYPAFQTIIFPVAAWIIFLAWAPGWRSEGPVMPAFLDPYALTFCLALTLVCLALLARRLQVFYTVYRRGCQIPGRIASITMQRDHAIVEYSYTFEKDRYTSKAQVHRSQRLKALKKGELVVLLVDQLHPKTALIRDLYTA